MPQIANINLAKDFTGSPVMFLVSPCAVSTGKEASWRQTTYPELARNSLDYRFRKEDPGTGLVRHSFKCVLPTLRSVVTDPSGPYVPPPALDYVLAWEMNFWVPRRATEAERGVMMASCLNPTGDLKNAISAVVGGDSFY